ncbi:MAG: Gfo/Idh/MocA family oxidoreductase [Thermoguttaceae bacterium]|jgi:predicted dehydrogenase|nr:Gfo/Idh/MocA family oxidoreductase [Thermoguttaceae bacterium]
MLNRRQFVRRTAAASAVFAVPMVASRRVLGANEEIRVGLVGCGVRGSHHMARFGGQEGVRVAAVCDPDRSRGAAAAARVKERYKNDPAQFIDPRKMIDAGNLDVVAVATMQYWHALPTIWACQAGMDVFVEKPLAHFILEGQRMVQAARKYNRLVQIGTQARSRKSDIQTIQFLQEGGLGKIKYITAFANKPRNSIGKRDMPLPIPEELDYDLWCGPADDGPVYRDRLQYDCSFTWDKGDGESCNQGVHEIDVARWLLGEPGLPRRTISIGGRFVFDDAGDVPNTQIIYYDYPTAPVLYQVYNLRAAKGSNEVPTFRGSRTEVCAHCEGGYAMVHSGSIFDHDGKKIQSFSGGEDLFENFIRAVRSQRREDLDADILGGHVSTAVTHVGNISYRVGEQASQSECRERIAGVPLFEEMFDRLVDHLKAHEIDVDAKTITLGKWLDVDTEKECIKNHDDANAIVRGFYRAPYLLPEIEG